ncbi:MAG: methyltransferase domain-containing protein [Candidatus Heimdallarchaeota archaeon]|nr:MAG: methyltransferase domain-containing protein [Candidatus Heimdallarchaeota archaeon]
MKVLEETPDEYESGIIKLTAGKISEVYEKILEHVNEGSHVLDLGCGPGTLAVLCAKKGAHVVAIDFSEEMITFAYEKGRQEEVLENLTFLQGDITQLDTLLPERKFDLIVSTLALSELRHLEQQLVFDQCWELLTKEGKIAFADEVKPHKWGIKRLIYSIRRFFYAVATYWKTKKTSRALKRFQQRLKASGFETLQIERFVRDTFELIISQKQPTKPPPTVLSDQKLRGIRGQTRNISCILRAGSALIPIEPGLYIYGNPSEKSPVLVTANYQRTVRIVGRVLKNQDAYLLVADTMGENVWCAARGDKFGLREVAEVIKATRIEEQVQHRKLILPQLTAGGIDHREVKATTGWSCRFGPIYAKDISLYLASGKKTEKQRTISFKTRERLEMALQQSYFLSKFFFFWFFLIGIVGINILPQVTLFSIAILLFPMIWLVYLFFALIFPLFPTRSFLRRGIYYGGLLTIIFLGIGKVLEYTLVGMSQWAVIGFAIGMFLGMDYSGATPISKPTEIDEEYPTMIILLGISLILLLVLTVIGLILGG